MDRKKNNNNNNNNNNNKKNKNKNREQQAQGDGKMFDPCDFVIPFWYIFLFGAFDPEIFGSSEIPIMDSKEKGANRDDLPTAGFVEKFPRKTLGFPVSQDVRGEGLILGSPVARKNTAFVILVCNYLESYEELPIPNSLLVANKKRNSYRFSSQY